MSDNLLSSLAGALPPSYPLTNGRFAVVQAADRPVGGWYSGENSGVPFLVVVGGDDGDAAEAALAAAAREWCASYAVWAGEGGCAAWAVTDQRLQRLSSLAEVPFLAESDRGRRAREGQQVLFTSAGAEAKAVASLFERVHNEMRDGDGLQPPEALDELLRILFLTLHRERGGQAHIGRRRLRWCDGRTQQEPPASHAQWLRGVLREATADDRDGFVLMDSVGSFGLSDGTLSRVADHLSEARLGAMPVDLRSRALSVFLSNDVRRGLGVYPTPDLVVQMVVRALAPDASDRILDPACGTGSFLLHTLYERCTQPSPRTKSLVDDAPAMWAVEKNLRILRVAEVNIAALIGRSFHAWNGDALLPFNRPTEGRPDWFAPGSFDLVMTNPPFGVTINAGLIEASGFGVARNEDGSFTPKMGSEVLFVERCLDFLRPGGVLSIVVPNSVITNTSLDRARAAIDEKGQLLAVVSLPSETFATTGTQSSTSVVFLQRRGGRGRFDVKPGEVFVVTATNVGFDNTGRPREGSELPAITKALRSFLLGHGAPEGSLGRVAELPAGREFFAYGRAPGFSRRTRMTGGIRLGDCATLVRTGRTPPRDCYADSGHFILKVGNLTGCGIEWFARDRNFVDKEYIAKLSRGRISTDLFVRRGDILLTSSAHTVRYIAKKVDMVDDIPEFVGEPVTFVGELMLVRPNPTAMDPLYLLAFLRSEGAQSALQEMVRGQTAHLMPADAAELLVPAPASDPHFAKLAELMRAEATAQAASQLRRTEMDALIASMFA